MRNLLEYPLNEDELLAAIKRARDLLTTTQAVGDLDALALGILYRWLDEHPDVMSDIVFDTRP